MTTESGKQSIQYAFARARSARGNQCATSTRTAGQTPPSASPSTSRMTQNSRAECTNPVAIEQNPQATSKMATTRLALQCCARCPAGICSNRYPQKKMPSASPACCGSICRSALICGSAIETLVRSMYAIVYITNETVRMRSQRCSAILSGASDTVCDKVGLSVWKEVESAHLRTDILCCAHARHRVLPNETREAIAHRTLPIRALLVTPCFTHEHGPELKRVPTRPTSEGTRRAAARHRRLFLRSHFRGDRR